MTDRYATERGRRSRWRWLLVGAIGVLAVAVLVVAGRWSGSTATPLNQAETLPASPPAGSGDRGGNDGLLRPAYLAELEQANKRAVELVRLGERQSRNILEITAAQRRMEDQLATVDALLAGRTPSSLASSVRSYRQGASRVQAAMRDARDGFLRFDWERVAGAKETLAAGTADLERALEEARSGG